MGCYFYEHCECVGGSFSLHQQQTHYKIDALSISHPGQIHCDFSESLDKKFLMLRGRVVRGIGEGPGYIFIDLLETFMNNCGWIVKLDALPIGELLLPHLHIGQ